MTTPQPSGGTTPRRQPQPPPTRLDMATSTKLSPWRGDWPPKMFLKKDSTKFSENKNRVCFIGKRRNRKPKTSTQKKNWHKKHLKLKLENSTIYLGIGGTNVFKIVLSAGGHLFWMRGGNFSWFLTMLETFHVFAQGRSNKYDMITAWLRHLSFFGVGVAGKIAVGVVTVEFVNDFLGIYCNILWNATEQMM